MEKKVHLPKPAINPARVIADSKNVFNQLLHLSKLNNQEMKSFFETVKNKTKDIVLSPNLTTLEKYNELNRYKSELEFAKVNAREYQVKQINQVISNIVLPAENNLLQRLQIEKKHGVIEKKLPEEKSTPKEMNSNSEEVIRIHSKTQPELENKMENENESIRSESEFVGMKKNRFEYTSDESLPDSSPKIKMNLSKEEVYNFFERLCRFKNELNNQSYLSNHDLDQFLSQSIFGYSEKPVPRKLLV